jgi:hypothetical protein
MPALHLTSPPAARLRHLLVLLLLALGLLAGVSVSQTHALHAEAVQTEVVRLPALLAVNDLARQVDEQRGMAALHLTLADEAGRNELEARLQVVRSTVERRLASLARLMVDEAGRAHHRGVSQGLARFWDAQDQMVALSRRAAVDTEAARQARVLLGGEAQQAFLRVRGDIVAWSVHLEQAAVQQAADARQAAHLVVQAVWALAALTALALAVGWAVLRWPQPAAPAFAAADGPDAALPQRLRSGIDPHLQALNAAVATARRGEPGRGAGLSAQEAHQLADQVAAVAQGLRSLVDRPRTTDSTAGDKLPR